MNNTDCRLIQPYLFFEGRCEEALNYYHEVLGAETVALMRYKDSPDTSMCQPNTLDKIMHAAFRFGTTTVMASDGRCSGTQNYSGFSLSIALTDEAESAKLFAELAKSGQVQMPYGKTFFSPGFGMVADKFGVPWMVYTIQPGQH